MHTDPDDDLVVDTPTGCWLDPDALLVVEARDPDEAEALREAEWWSYWDWRDAEP